MESRCTVIGISVAESGGIQGTWPDSQSMLLCSRLPARPQLRPSVGVISQSCIVYHCYSNDIELNLYITRNIQIIVI